MSVLSLPEGIDHETLLLMIEEEEQFRLAEKAKTDYLSYCIYSHGGLFKPTRHAKVICQHIQEALDESERISQRVANGERLAEGEGVVVLLISMPPQHGKSMTVVETLPSYFLGRNPNKTALLISYNQDTAKRFGSRNRMKIEQYGKELFGVTLDRSKSSKEDFSLSNGVGAIKSIGLNGSITGNPGHLVIIDDPYKNGKDARSPKYRADVQAIFDDSVATRLHPGSIVIVVHTRWHEDDLIAYLKSFYGDRAKVLSIPAECEDEATDPIGRKLGEFLWEEHHQRQYYLDNKKRNSRVWAALFQQRPAPVEGAMFRKSEFRSYNKSIFTIPNTNKLDYSKFKYLVMSWDCAFEADSTSDFVVGHVVGYMDGNYYLLHRVKKRMDFIDSHTHILSYIKRYPAVRIKLIEKKANGHAIIQTLERRDKVRGIVPISPRESKEVRAESVAYIINDGRVYLPDDDPTIDELIEEFGNFPYGKHDDEVDAMVQAIRYIEDKVSGRGKVRF